MLSMDKGCNKSRLDQYEEEHDRVELGFFPVQVEFPSDVGILSTFPVQILSTFSWVVV